MKFSKPKSDSSIIHFRNRRQVDHVTPGDGELYAALGVGLREEADGRPVLIPGGGGVDHDLVTDRIARRVVGLEKDVD